MFALKNRHLCCAFLYEANTADLQINNDFSASPGS